MDWSQVTALTIPEGSVKQVSVNGVVLWKKGSPLSDYTQLEYIESTGTQWIDTGIATTNNNLGFMLEAMPLTNADVYPMGSHATNGNIRFFGVRSTSSGGFSYGWSFYQTAPASQSYVNVRTTMSLNWLNSKKVTIGNDSKDLATVDIANGRNITIFGINGQLLWTGRIYRAQISEGNEIIANFIPVMRNSDSKVGMYDTITRQFFTNAGTGEFIAGLRFVDYIESTGEQYLIIPYRVNNKTQAYIRYNQTAGGPDVASVVIGVVSNTPSPNMARSGLLRLLRGTMAFNRVGWGDDTIGSIKDISGYNDFNTWYEVLFDLNNIYIDGNLVATSATPTTNVWKASYDLGIFARNGSSATMPTPAKISRVYAKEDEDYVLDLRPCLDPSGVACMYDMVSKQYFYNQGTGTFTAGNTLN